MSKTFVGPQLRQLRRSHDETQARMAERLGISPAYVNLLESNQRSLSVQVLVAITEAYGVDWRELLREGEENRVPELRAAMRDPIFPGDAPDVQELRAALDHAPRVVDRFLQLYQSHTALTDRLNRMAGTTDASDIFATSPETAIHDVFRDHGNYFDVLERVAENFRSRIGGAADDMYASMKRFLRVEMELTVQVVSPEQMPDTLRLFDRDRGEVWLSQALDHTNRVFQLAHVLGLLVCSDHVDTIVSNAEIADPDAKARLAVELTNYFAGAILMPYEAFLSLAEETKYDLDRLASAFGVSFEQVCHRLTTLQREGRKGVPFFFLRADRAGNVTKRFNSTPFTLADRGGSCPVWDIHGALRTPGVMIPRFVQLPDGGQFFTLCRSTDRPVFSRGTQDRRLAVALGCERAHADKICYAEPFNLKDPEIFHPIGISCHVCPRKACTQRAHQPLNIQLGIDADRRGSTRYES